MEEKQGTTKNIQETIATEFGFDDLSDESQRELIEQMTESVIKRVLIESYTKLSDSDREEFEEMMENVEEIDPNSIDEFLNEKLTDYDAVIAEAIDDLKKRIATVEETNRESKE
jgi:hypothetical protein